MDEPACSRRDAASVVFNLPGYDVIDAVDLPLGGRRVVVQAVERDEGCPDCGVISTRVHAWVKQRVRDIPAGGDVVEVGSGSPAWCAPRTDAGGRRSPRPPSSSRPGRGGWPRLREHLADAVLDSGRAVEEVAASYGVAWWTVQDAVDAAVVELPEVDTLRVRHLGVDEHRFARARFFRDDTGGRQRVEPWMSTFVNTDTGQVLGIVDGRDSTGIQGWLDARTPAWRDRIEVVAMCSRRGGTGWPRGFPVGGLLFFPAGRGQPVGGLDRQVGHARRRRAAVRFASRYEWLVVHG